MNYKGVIIEESLENKDIFKDVVVLSTEVEPVTDEHQTPWIKQWTLHKVEVAEDKADEVAEKLCRALDKEHHWYADFENDKYHYIIYRNKIFKVDMENPVLYKKAREYGISLGIPEHQVDFDTMNKQWIEKK